MAQQQLDRFQALAAELRLFIYAYCFEWAEEVNCDLLSRPPLFNLEVDSVDLPPGDLHLNADHAISIIGTDHDAENDVEPVSAYCTLLPTFSDYLKTPAILRASRQTNIEATELLNKRDFRVRLSRVRYMVPRWQFVMEMNDDNRTMSYNDRLVNYQGLREVYRDHQCPDYYTGFSIKFPERPIKQWGTTFWLKAILALIWDVGQGRGFQVTFATDCEKCDGTCIMAAFDTFAELVCANNPPSTSKK